MVDSKRIEFIDLAKGVCIILVVLQHIGLDVNFMGFVSMRMPLYFVLSGLFFKDYGSLHDFVLKKTNKLLVPFAFFYLLGYVLYYGVNILFAGRGIYGNFDPWAIFSFFDRRLYFNGPIWFLLALFWANLIFCVITLNVRREWVRGVVVVLCGAVGYVLGVYKVQLPCVMDVALIALPFFYLGYILKKTPLLYPNRFDRYNIVIALVLVLVSVGIDYFGKCPRIWFHFNVFYGNILLAVLISVTSVGAVLFVCKALGRLPLISYIGRYSIVFLCWHHLVYRHLFLVFNETVAMDRCIVAGLTMMICLALTPLSVKYIPYFVAQKDLIIKKGDL